MSSTTQEMEVPLPQWFVGGVQLRSEQAGFTVCGLASSSGFRWYIVLRIHRR